MNKVILLCTIVSAVLLSGCEVPFSIAQVDPIRPFKVKLKVEEGMLRVYDKGPNKKCDAFSEPLRKGCFVAEEGEVLELQFKLKKRSEGANWRLTELRICAGDTKPTDSNPCALNAQQQAEWLVIAKKSLALVPKNGTVDLTQFSDRLRVLTILDINAHEGDFTYQLRACKEGSLDDGDCAWMDPGGTNKGRP
jgi:hypothetical protein